MIHSADPSPQFLPTKFAQNALQQRQRQPSAGLAGSIWAPVPQPSEATWPSTLDSFSRVVDRVDNEYVTRTDHGYRRTATDMPLISREDVFGVQQPPGPLAPSRPPRDVGAIGDGRKRASPQYTEDTHVEQLLRTLNLNSPAPFASAAQKPLVSLDTTPNSPDFSPASVSSALLTPTDLSPVRPFDAKFPGTTVYEANPPLQTYHSHSSLLFDNGVSEKNHDGLVNANNLAGYHQIFQNAANSNSTASLAYFDNYTASSAAALPHSLYSTPAPRHMDLGRAAALEWRLASQMQMPQRPQSNGAGLIPDWRALAGKGSPDHHLATQDSLRSSINLNVQTTPQQNEPINFLSLLHPSSNPNYPHFVNRIIKNSDQQASIFLQQKLKVADVDERAKIVDAICARGFEMMAHRFGNWAVQRCLEAAATAEERRKIVSCMRGRIVELATNCYGCHVLQKALDCEEDIRLLIVSELLLGDPAQTLINKHASHVWSKIMELSWTPPAPPIFAYVNKSLKGKWASLACHETGSLVVQHAFENLEAEAKDGIVEELLNQGAAVFKEVAKNQWGSYCIQHILEHGSEKHKRMTLDHLLEGLLEFATNEQGSKSVTKALKEGGKETLDRVVKRMCEPAKGARRAMIVDLALSVTGSQLIASVLPNVDKDQRGLLYDCIRGHIVTLRGCKTGSKVIWLLYVLPLLLPFVALIRASILPNLTVIECAHIMVTSLENRFISRDLPSWNLFTINWSLEKTFLCTLTSGLST
ncbi:pumilio-family RNA binding repeat protein [Coprinopsis cinerea okayama7|uniref:Pumilio-family RNA binding repeat protein n=1 Tax=Coprinopsis cinerea (strain Okayama-7 / 130 / ATCC MYA-4618 / FGSC 9003) TaxID=240176 RepID=A8N3Q2_COPC7|nr:pumilio-family RNA binding repeat protein [Coprinopsis cinerea okayama7\|eukprot:XP_001829518.1 pumilio-family RNA binding repeat protein [Coprinopsis cinerea okayama7\